MTHIRKRIRKLSTAVFRGAKSEYNFDVFPIATGITDASAVLIFSRRKLDKNGKAHHVVSCLGETHSIAAEIKRHRRAACIRAGMANVVCILKEADGDTRANIVEDIKSARTFRCVRGVIKSAPKPKSRSKRGNTALPTIPISNARAKRTVAGLTRAKAVRSIRTRKKSAA